jgi:hypothetical protein
MRIAYIFATLVGLGCAGVGITIGCHRSGNEHLNTAHTSDDAGAQGHRRERVDIIKEGLGLLMEAASVRGNDGHIVFKFGLVTTMFFREPWTEASQKMVSEVAGEYIRSVRPHLRWAQEPFTWRMYPIDANEVEFPEQSFPKLDDGQNWAIGFSGGDDVKDASEFMIRGLGSDETERDLGYLQIYLPGTWFVGQPGAYREFVLNLAKRLHPVSGYGGLGVQEPLDDDARFAACPFVRKIAEQFPGLEIESPESQSVSMADGSIKGASWLTVLGDEAVKKIGGVDSLKVRLGESFPIKVYEGGIMIQAGPHPEIGDVKKNEWPRHLVTLSTVLKPIRVKDPHPFYDGDSKGAACMDRDATNAWINRFDGK